MLEVHERVLRGEPAVLGDADRSDGARVDEAVAAGPFDGAQHVLRAADVHVVEEVGIGGPEPVHRREVKDRRDAVDGAVERGGIADVADDPVDGQACEIVVSSARLAQRPDRVAVVEQGAHDRGTDEAGRAGDENRSGIQGRQPQLLTYPATTTTQRIVPASLARSRRAWTTGFVHRASSPPRVRPSAGSSAVRRSR